MKDVLSVLFERMNDSLIARSAAKYSIYAPDGLADLLASAILSMKKGQILRRGF